MLGSSGGYINEETLLDSGQEWLDAETPGLQLVTELPRGWEHTAQTWGCRERRELVAQITG